ncbi:predicted protein [Aspergillus terreus NIH2624]|uniref:Uncharacterized protein n=1 Tax=Aspergillus terreus (strain NIH 2624 / FGSC A1156) TaxID=341663 RepID=Q0CLU0_ASPTN|nr:uncharacterized protein ATEG_05344 [Aspergillus terreus NIH2624]EAU34413.1 predicted protein [Aspergillus terreus NIH2624]
MDRPRQLDDLADELISDILSFLLLSCEHPSSDASPISFHQDAAVPSNGIIISPTTAYAYGERSELDRFRLVCRRFMRIATPRKFPRFVLRFSLDGFQRLEELLHMQLACHVRYFTYMVRPFYQGSGWPDVLADDHLPAASIHRRRLHDQTAIVDCNQDLTLLRRALAAFSSLQQIKLLRLQDAADERLLDHFRQCEPREPSAPRLDWDCACTRAVSSLAIALLESPCTAVRFVGPQISPDAALHLLHTPTPTLAALAPRLTSLEVTFHAAAPKHIPSKIHALSPVFHDFFLAATNLAAIHLGFPATRPLALPLDRVFHRVQWKRLRALSLQGWRLGADEIIALVRRHRRPLRDLRLTSIFLDAGRWRDVLAVMHDEMDHLDRVDLRDINYAAYLDALDFPHGHAHSQAQAHAPPPPGIVLDIPQPALFASSSSSSSSSSSPSPSSGTAQSHGNRRPSLTPATRDRLRSLTADELGDNGVSVGCGQNALWEAWVLASPRDVVRRRF